MRAGQTPLPIATDLVVFFEADESGAVASALAEQMAAASAPLTFFNREGVPIGGAMVSGHFAFPEPASLVGGLRELLTSPVMWLVGLLLLLALALALIRPRITRRAWRDLSGEFGASFEPAAAQPTEAEPALTPDHRSPPLPARPPEGAELEAAEPALQSAVVKPVSQPAAAPLLQAIADPPSPALGLQAPVVGGSRFVEVEFRIRFNLDGATRLLDFASQRVRPRTAPRAPRVAGRLAVWNSAPVANAGWPLAALVLAVTGQFVVNGGDFVAGGLLYLAAGAIFLVWAFRRPPAAQAVLSAGTLGRRAEMTLLLLVAAIAVTARFYNAGNKPYGLEGDETKWVMQSYFSTILDVPRGDFGHHFQYLPVSFYLQGLAMRLWGINFLAPRYLNALLSALSVLLLYFTARRAIGPPVALTAAFLYAVSFTALSAGRQALHNTHIEFWVLLAGYLIVEAVETRRWGVFAAAGLAAAVGMLTYETYYMTPIVAFIYLAVCAARDRAAWRSWLGWIGTFALPIALVMPSTVAYYGIRQGYHLEPLRGVVAGSAPAAGLLEFFGERLAESTQTLFYRIRWTDSLLNWEGPFVNPWLLPFFVIGLLLAVYHFRRRYFLFFVLWFGLQYFPFGMLGAPFPRVFYPAAMAIYVLAALGLCGLLLAARRFYHRLDSQWLLAGFAGLLLLLALFDLYVFSARLIDPQDRRKRRELSDLLAASVEAAPMIYLPYLSFDNDVVRQEVNLLEFTAAGVRGVERPTDYYTVLPFDQLLPRLWEDRSAFASARVIFDKTEVLDTAVR
ncbi:MAG: glycosyltransferase family 39 protein, partial [Chloroflexi bacterium]|nr:glycosyltransferase family 39 protein [Chloroflexota bacterium]